MAVEINRTFQPDPADQVGSTSRLFTSAVDKFLGSINLIEALAQIISPKFKTVTANRRRLGRSVINRTMEIASALACYASMVGDNLLSARVSLSPAMIARSWDPVIIATARGVYELSEELIQAGKKEAALCGVTEEKNQLLLNSIIAFSAAIGSEVEESLSGPVCLYSEFRRAEEILENGIDPLVSALKAQSEAFFASYRHARQLAEAIPQQLRNF